MAAVSIWDDLPGFISFNTAYFIHFVSKVQAEVMDISGAIAEVGVAAGKSFGIMAHTRYGYEPLVACDIFKPGLEAGNVGDVNLPLFLDVMEAYQIAQEEINIVQQDSLRLSDTDMVNNVDRAALARLRAASPSPIPLTRDSKLVPRVGGFRLFHIDGAHYLEAALHDITTVACSMVQGGVVLIDDVHNFGWPGVQEAFNRYMLSHPQPRRLFPFLFTGRLFLTTSAWHADGYRRHIQRSFPQAPVNAFHGQPVVGGVNLELSAEDFSRLYDED